MPSISQKALDDMRTREETLVALLNEAKDRRTYLERQVTEFDNILDEIVQAARGGDLMRALNYDTLSSGGVSPNSGMMIGESRKPRQIGHDERHEMEAQYLHGHVASLESRLSAVVAVASFAKRHKA